MDVKANLPVCIVTGANVGVGYYTAQALVRCGYAVVLACRSPEKGRAAATSINAASVGGGYSVFMHLDLASLASVRSFAATFLEHFTCRLHALVLNAGINSFGLTASERRTADGFDLTFQSNYIGHFVLAQLLVPYLQRTADADTRALSARGAAATDGLCVTPCRLVTVSSVVHRTVSRTDIDWAAAFSSPDASFSGMSTYTLSKLAMALLAMEWQRRIDGGSGKAARRGAGAGGRVECVTVSPGSVRSSIWRRVPAWGYCCWDTVMAGAFLTPAQGAATSIAAVTAPAAGSMQEPPSSGLRIRGADYLVPYYIPVASEPWATLAEGVGPFAGMRACILYMRLIASPPTLHFTPPPPPRHHRSSACGRVTRGPGRGRSGKAVGCQRSSSRVRRREVAAGDMCSRRIAQVTPYGGEAATVSAQTTTLEAAACAEPASPVTPAVGGGPPKVPSGIANVNVAGPTEAALPHEATCRTKGTRSSNADLLS